VYWEPSLASIFSKMRPEQQVPSRLLATDKRVFEKTALRQALTPDPSA
jgi:hypothetical protein